MKSCVVTAADELRWMKKRGGKFPVIGNIENRPVKVFTPEFFKSLQQPVAKPAVQPYKNIDISNRVVQPNDPRLNGITKPVEPPKPTIFPLFPKINIDPEEKKQIDEMRKKIKPVFINNMPTPKPT